ncbi:MAG: thermonuclease family protein [Phycisphaerae bacterium]|nr:thermonuclease family protein [Phycisphaerae bacterium]
MRRRMTPRSLATSAILLAAAALVYYLSHRGAQSPLPGEDDYLRYHNKTFRVVNVVDGDTLDLDAPDGEHSHTRVRLWGVDTPETVDPRKSGADYYGREASDFSKRTAGGQDIRVELVPNKTRDTYDRLLAYIYLPDGTMLNERLLEGGFGYADTRFGHVRMERFKRLESRAEKAKQGLWKDVQPNQWPEWRQRMHESRGQRSMGTEFTPAIAA